MMNPEPTAETVLLGLKALYHSPDATEKENASKWLEEFQKSVSCWNNYLFIYLKLIILVLSFKTLYVQVYTGFNGLYLCGGGVGLVVDIENNRRPTSYPTTTTSTTHTSTRALESFIWPKAEIGVRVLPPTPSFMPMW